MDQVIGFIFFRCGVCNGRAASTVEGIKCYDEECQNFGKNLSPTVVEILRNEKKNKES